MALSLIAAGFKTFCLCEQVPEFVLKTGERSAKRGRHKKNNNIINEREGKWTIGLVTEKKAEQQNGIIDSICLSRRTLSAQIHTERGATEKKNNLSKFVASDEMRSGFQ